MRYEQHEAWKFYKALRGYEERRIRQIKDPEKQAKAYEWLERWSEETEKSVIGMIDQQEATIADIFEDLQHER